MSLTHQQRRDRRKAVADMVKDGKTYGEVATILGVSINLVHSACREHGVSGMNFRVRDRSLEMIAALQSGRRPSDVAREFGVTRQAVCILKRRCRQAKVKLKKSDWK